MQKGSLKPLFSVLTVILLLFNVSHVESSDWTKAKAEDALSEAENSLILAYKSVLDAESAGANVTSLTEKLSAAGANLTEAYLHYKEKNYGEAVILAETCTEIAEEVKNEAELLNHWATLNARLFIWTQIFGWFISTVMVTMATFFSWRVFKKRYYRKVLEMRMEGASSEH